MSALKTRFSQLYRSQSGYISKPGDDQYHHRFGGDSWEINTPEGCDRPALLIVFDLNDDRLSSIGETEFCELPLCSYINSDCWIARHDYIIDFDKKKVLFHSCNNPTGFELTAEDKFTLPLPERRLCLDNMDESDYPVDEDSYWNCTDEILGGDKYIRVLGMPLWLQEPEDVRCNCGKDKTFIATIGYENWDGPYRLLDDKPFFFGEGVIYFFYCNACKSISVISQTT